MKWERIMNSSGKKKLFIIAAALVAFFTIYSLVLPAITLDNDTAGDEPSLNTDTISQEETNIYNTVYDPFSIEQEKENELKQAEDTIFFYYESEEIKVTVEAPKDAFPEGTEMVVTPIDEEEVLDAVTNAVEKVKRVQAVDITFYFNGEEIEPLKPIKVSLVSDVIKEAKDLQIVHIDDEGTGSLVEQADVETKEDEVVFESKDFSTYVVVETEIETTVITADGERYNITVSYDENAMIPEGAHLEAEEILPEDERYQEYYDTLTNELKSEPNYVRFFDISIMDGDKKLQPASKVAVRIELDDLTDDSLKAVHIPDHGEMEVLDVDVKEDSAVEFETKGFSVYAVIGQGENARMALEFYNGENKLATVYVKNGDLISELDHIIYDPGVGQLAEGLLFKGWFIEDPAGSSFDANTPPKTIEEIREWAANHVIVVPEGQDVEVVKIHAMVLKYYNVTYFGDDTEVSLGTHTIYLLPSETSAPYTVSMSYTPDSHQNFEGWKTTADLGGNHIAGWTEGSIYPNDSVITISGDVTFFVEAPIGNWLIYHANGKGGTYNAPQFYLEDEITVPAVNATDENMKRNGYSFGGWYTDPGCTPGNEFTFGGVLTDTTDIYAKWTPNETAPYTVILWGENSDRSAYEVIGSYVGNGRVGQWIPYTVVDNGDEDYVTGVGADNGHYTGFSIVDSDRNQQVTITPEGDAVLNLHFDRIEYDFKFYLYRDGSQNNRYDYANNSGNGSSLNDLVTWHSNQTQHPSVNGYTIQSETVGGRRYYYFVLHAYYGQDISAMWPTYDTIIGANGREAVSYVMMVGTKLKPRPTNTGSGTVKGLITVLNENILGATNDADGNYVIVRFPGNYNNWRYHIWFETVDGEDYTGKPTHNYNGKTYYEETVLVVRSSNTEVSSQNEPKYGGFEFIEKRGQNWNNSNYWTTGNNPTLYHLNFVYNRLKAKIEYFDGSYVDGSGNLIQNRATHPLRESNEINQGAIIPDADRNYVPALPEGEQGYVFEGWYLDEGCTTPYVWNKMPVDGIKVYAKWRQIQYRVFLHPNAVLDGQPDPTLSWGDEHLPEEEKQQMTFRISYGNKVSTPTGRRTGYEFVGWFRDPACTLVFNDEAFELNESTVTAAYNKETDFTDVMDKWGNGATYNNDLSRWWVTKKLDLYGKWRLILEGADGIHIVYDPGAGTNEPTDPLLYTDQANALAQAASTPNDAENMQFLYWIVQKYDETTGTFKDTAVEVYPGDSFTVKATDAQIVDNEDNSKTYTLKLRAAYGPKSVAKPTHITWYANNGTGASITDYAEGLQINEAINVRPASTYTYDGYKFLGWARLNETDDQGHDIEYDKLINLTRENLWLAYDEETDTFKATAITGGGTTPGMTITQIAADERLAYHGMYAVWERVYTLTVRKVVVGTDADKQLDFTFTPTGVTPTNAFTLKDSQEIVFEDLFKNTTVKITETENEDFAVTVAGYYLEDGSFPPVEHEISGLTNGSQFTIQGNTVITFTNTLRSNMVRVYKVDENDQPLSGVGFTLGSNELTTGTDGYTDTVALNPNTTPYVLTETVPKAHYNGLEGNVNVTVSASGVTISTATGVSISGPDENGVYTIKVVNTAISHPIVVYKTNVAGNPLDGAVFVLEGNTLASGEDGYTGSVDLNASDTNYELTESQAPDGYYPISGAVMITVNDDGVLYTQPDYHGGEPQTAALVSGNYVIQVRNNTGEELPNTGGSGTARYLVLGAILMTGSLLFENSLMRRKRKGEK